MIKSKYVYSLLPSLSSVKNKTNRQGETMKKKSFFTFSILALVIVIVLSLISKDANNFFINTVVGIMSTQVIFSALTYFFPNMFDDLILFAHKEHHVRKIFELYELAITNSSDLDTTDHKKYFLKLFKNKQITREFVEKLDSKKSCVLLIGLQYYYDLLNLSSNLDSSTITRLATKAQAEMIYIRLSLSRSLSSLFDDNGIRNEIVNSIIKECKPISVEKVPLYSERDMFDRISCSEQESVTIFSMTSQISGLSLETLKSSTGHIKEINYFMVSPLIESHISLLKLKREYEVPEFAIPPFQYVKDYTNLDMIRRTFKILNAIKNMVDFSENTSIKINLYLFTDSYPNIKLRLLNENSYLQLFPSDLKYANNLYRFGYEIHDSRMIRQFSTQIESIMKNPNFTKKISLTCKSFTELRDKALKELFSYILKKGYDPLMIEDSIMELKSILKFDDTEKYIRNILNFSDDLQFFINQYKFSFDGFKIDEKIKTDIPDAPYNIAIKNIDGVYAHISVGILFFKGEKVLLIRKKQKPYSDKYSIIAGHLEDGETPLEAMKREVKEEIGIEVNNISLIEGNLVMNNDVCKYGFSKHIWFIYKCTNEINEEIINVDLEEIEDFIWADKNAIDGGMELTFAAKIILQRHYL